VLTLTLAVLLALHTAPALAANASAIDQEATGVLQELYTRTEGAKILGEKAKGILIFPKIVKGGFIIGGQFGDGALRVNGTSVAYYRSVAASYGLQAGVQTFGYVLMFMDDASLAYLDQSDGGEIGVGPSIVVIDQGMGKS
jgi:lipid-binding SYLF domain-containing protein